MPRRRRAEWLPPARTGAAFLLALLAASGIVSGRLAADDFADGVAAYDAGDLRAAYETWLSLAEAGDGSAQVAVAGLLETGGPGVARDLGAAAAWYRRAARGGNAVAQMNLGQFYAQGIALPRDPVRALAWFALAAAQGRNWAAARHAELAATMTPEQREAAQELSAALRSGR